METFSAEPVFAENETDQQIDESLTIRQINFYGLKKTQNFYLQRKFKKYLNHTVKETNVHALETDLQMEGVFSDYKISFKSVSESDASIEITVVEKITFIPLPFIVLSDNGITAGGIIMDTNAFGVKDMFVVGGLYSPAAIQGLVSFSRSPQADTWAPGYSIFVSVAKNKPEYNNLDDDLIYKYKGISFATALTLSEKFGNYNTVSISGGFKSLSTSKVNNYEKLDSIKAGTAGLGWSFSKSDWNGWFMSTTSCALSANASISNNNEDKFAQEYSASFSFQKPIIPRIRAYSKASLYYSRKTHLSSYKGQSAASVNILPSNFYTDKLCGGNAGFEAALYKGKSCTISAYSDYQIAYVNEFYSDSYNDFKVQHGPNGGFRFYLAKIAFPALAMGLSYNVPERAWHFTAALGMNF